MVIDLLYRCLVSSTYMTITKGKLQELGLSEKEARVYLALFELGSSMVSDIAEKANVNRSTTYVILGTLSKRGLVSATEQQSGRFYNPTPPEQLVRHLEGTAKQYAGLADAARKLLPDLKSLEKAQKERKEANPRPKVRLYEGAEGIKTVYEDTLASLEYIRLHASGNKMRSAPLVSPEQFGSMPAISVYGDKIILVSPEEKFAAVVESRELAEKVKKMLDASRTEAGSKKPFLGTDEAAKNIA